MTMTDQNTAPEQNREQTSLKAEQISADDTSIEGKFFGRAKGLLTDIKAILDKETAALKACDLKAAVECQDVKIRLVQEYEQLLQEARAHSQDLKASEHPLKSEVKSLHTEMNASVEGNHRALRNSKRAVERITDRMMETIRKCVQGQENMSYSAAGTVSNNGRGLSINVDETL